MALATNVAVDLIPLGERPQYGMPYPEGIAVAASSAVDDASGGAHTFSVNVNPGFIFRLELFNLTRGESTGRVHHCVTVHRWAATRRPGLPAALDLNWYLVPRLSGGFSVYTMSSAIDTGGERADVMAMLRRFPMGPALGGGAPGVSDQLMLVTNDVNTDTITNELSIVWTYWRKESLYLPGFLSAFYEAPAIPPLVRQ